MADTKLTGLTDAGATDGTEYAYLSQGGVSVRALLSNLISAEMVRTNNESVQNELLRRPVGYASRAEFIAATIPASVTYAWIGNLCCVRDATGAAITSNGGSVNWSPYNGPFLAHYGAAQDGASDDTALVKSAMQIGDVDFSGGVSLVHPTPGVSTIVPANTEITGEIGDGVDISVTSAGTSLFAQFGADCSIDGLSVSMEHTLGAVVQFGQIAGPFSIESSEIDGKVVVSGGAVSHVAQSFELSNIDTDGFRSVGNWYKNLSRVILKNSASTTSQNDFVFAFDRFSGFTSESMAFNNPNGTTKNIRVIGCYNENNVANSVGGSGHWIGGASVQNFVAVGNVHYGTGDELFHLEEGANGAVCSGNVGYFTDARAGIFFTDNNVGGAYTPVRKTTASSNVIVRSARAGGTAGIDTAPNGVGTHPFEEGVITGNVSSGWERAYRADKETRRFLTSNNVFADSDVGIQVTRPSLTNHGNILYDNTVDISTQGSGTIGKQFHCSTATWDGTTTLIPAPTVSVGAELGVLGWASEYDGLTVTAAGKDYLIIPLGNFMSGDLIITAISSATNRRVTHYRPLWDGTTLTQNLVASYGAGISLVSLKDDGSGNLAIRYAAGADVPNVVFQVDFTGIHVFT